MAMPGFAATIASRMSRKACSARYSDVPPTRMAGGGEPWAICARTGFSGLGIRRRRQAAAVHGLRKHPLLLQFLAVDAVGGPGDGAQPLLADLTAAVNAGSEVAFLDAVEGLFNKHEQVALRVGEGEVELLGVGAGGLVGKVLNAVVGLGVAC